MKTLAKTKNMDRKTWLELRRKGIGGSDVSIIAGVNKFKSVFQLWLEKTGRAELEETDSEYAHFGTVLEPLVKKEFTRRTGRKVRARNEILQSEEHPFMLCDLDGVVYENGEMCIFEAKTASAYKQEVWEQGVPVEYILQVQHYMAVTGAKKAYVAALVGGNHFYAHTVMRDGELIGMITAMEKEFWEKNVLGGVEPVPDGSDATTSYLNERYGKCNGQTIELPEEALEVVFRYEDVTQQMKEIEERKEALANQLRNYLGENEAGTVGGKVVTWKQLTRKYLDTKRLEKEKQDVYDEYLTESRYRRLTVA
ncbi:MAG: YqaJ viral recombinase family protein [bacterium]|nr:YqaJ viral recombinase family protein [bacterium]